MTTLASKEELISRRDPQHTVTVEPCAKWVRVMHNGQFIADSRRALLLFETRHTPVYYFPREDVRMDMMSPTDLVTQCPYKGGAEYYTLNEGDAAVENVMWAYTAPFDVCPDISNYIAFYWNKGGLLVRGGRGDLRPRPRPAQARRLPAEHAARPRRAGRRDARREHPPRRCSSRPVCRCATTCP